jgi:predicted nucleotidyltransferase
MNNIKIKGVKMALLERQNSFDLVSQAENLLKDETLVKIIDLIVSLVAPDQIILFGSYARGDQNEKSDIDLLILKKGLIKGREMSYVIRRAFYKTNLEKSVDVLALDYDKYNASKDDIGFIYHTIQAEGVIIYGNI